MSYILIAEDDRDLLLLVQRKLELSGYQNIWTTPDGKSAYDQALQEIPRLMILDIMLPLMNGLDVCFQIKEHYGEEAPPVIIMSARGQREHLEEGQQAGADAYIIKPFSPKDLIAKVDALIR